MAALLLLWALWRYTDCTCLDISAASWTLCGIPFTAFRFLDPLQLPYLISHSFNYYIPVAGPCPLAFPLPTPLSRSCPCPLSFPLAYTPVTRSRTFAAIRTVILSGSCISPTTANKGFSSHQPQRPSRPQPSLGHANNENMIPAIFGMDQRHKAVGAPIAKHAGDGLKPNAKRTAFGDVSNVLRSVVPDSAVYGFKPNVTMSNTASGISATGGKENTAQTAGFLAPAQRAKISATVAPVTTELNVVRALQAYHGKTEAGAVRQAAVVFNTENDIGRAAGTHAVAAKLVDNSIPASTLLAHNSNLNKIKQSPRHHKSQPCLKNALDHQVQKKILRRTQSRLPEDRPQPKDVAIFTDNSTAEGREPDGFSESEFHDADDTPYVDAVEDIYSNVLSALDDTVNGVRDRHDETEAAASHQPSQQETQVQSHYCTVEQEHLDFLSEVPAVPTGSIAEAEEPWDEDGDFYDEQGYTTAHSFRSLGDNTTGGLTTIMMPKVTVKIQNELDFARSIVEASLSPEEIDDEAWDISMVAEYGEDINDYMRELEVNYFLPFLVCQEEQRLT